MERIKSFRTFFRIFAFFIFAFAFSVNSFAAGKKKTKKSDKNAYVFYDENSEATDIEEMEVDKISGQKQTEIQNEIVQPFAWENAGDVLYYEILIEKFNDESEQWEEYIYHETDEEETEECVIYLNPILSPGKYRSTIKIYNILGVLEEESLNFLFFRRSSRKSET